ncbi:MAG TPA: ion channel [Humisphaera sp.]
MDGHTFFRWAEPFLGVPLMLVVLADVFLTVLYARMGTSLLGERLGRALWLAFRAAAAAVPSRRDRVLAYAGPVIVLTVLAVWVGLLMLGAALVIHPHLGTGVTSSSGQTKTDFMTAVFAAGNSITLVGSGNFSPQTPAFKAFYIVNSFVGMTMISLTLTYLMQIYAALLRRNTLALAVHEATGETGDAAALIGAVGPQGNFSNGYTHLAQLASEMRAVKEAHHFYPVLVYFRFDEPYYTLSRLTTVLLDAVTLIKSGLDDEEYASLKQSAAVNGMWRAAVRLLASADDVLLSRGLRDAPAADPDAYTLERWRRRYDAGLRRLREAGLRTIADEQKGFDAYVSLRVKWVRLVTAFAEFMAVDVGSADPVGTDPQSATDRPDFAAPQLHAAR